MNINNKLFCRKGLVSICFIGIILFTQLWYAYPVLRHPKLHYWAFLNAQAENPNAKSIKSLYNNWITAVRRQEYAMNYDSNLFIDIFGASRECLGLYSYNNIVKLNNGWIIKTSEINKDFESVNYFEKIKSSINDRNLPFLFVLPPSKVHLVDSQLPKGVKDYSNENISNFIKVLQKHGFDYIDLRNVFKNNPDEHYRLYLKSDHHWQPEYAFFAFQQTALKLNSNYGFNISEQLYNLENFEEKTVPVKERPYFSIGVNSQRKQLGRFFTEEDAFILFEPKFQTDTSLEIPYLNVFIEGSSDKVWRQNALTPLQKASNPSQQKKIMLIHDSFGPPYFDYLSLACNQLWSADLRKIPDFQTLVDIINDFQPDILIILLNESSL